MASGEKPNEDDVRSGSRVPRAGTDGTGAIWLSVRRCSSLAGQKAVFEAGGVRGMQIGLKSSFVSGNSETGEAS